MPAWPAASPQASVHEAGPSPTPRTNDRESSAMSRRRGPLLVLLVALMSSCGESSALPPGRPVPASDVAPVEPSASTSPVESSSLATDSLDADPLETDSLDTLPPERPTTVDPVLSPSDPEEESDVLPTGCVSISVPTGTTQIAGERCDPAPFFSGPRPAALVLNGCGGYAADAEIGRAIAAALVREGIVAVRIDYLGAASEIATCEDPLAGLRNSSEEILQAISDTAALLRIDPTIDTASIGAVGYSLGGLTVMSAVLGGTGLSSTAPIPLSPVALLSYPNLLPEVPAGLAAGFGPELFVVTGEVDDAAPIADSRAVVDAAVEGGVQVEQLVVPGQGHTWTGPTASLVGSVIADELADRFAG